MHYHHSASNDIKNVLGSAAPSGRNGGNKMTNDFRSNAVCCVGAAALALVGLVGATSASAQSLVFDRGLPTDNLNNAAGASRSNIQWADWEATAVPSTFYRPGDDFTLAGTGTYNITTIRVWSKDSTGVSLLGGVAGGSIGLQSSSFTSTLVSGYAGGSGYQGSSGGFTPVYQIDFNVNIAVNGGQTYQFFLDGGLKPSGSGFENAAIHASNAPLSGSPEAGADGTFLYLAPDGSVQTWMSGPPGGGTLYAQGWTPGWDKNSDANVQVFGTVAAVPEPETYAMLLAGLGLVGAVVRRRKNTSV